MAFTIKPVVEQNTLSSNQLSTDTTNIPKSNNTDITLDLNSFGMPNTTIPNNETYNSVYSKGSFTNALKVKNKLLYNNMDKVQEYVALPGNVVRVVLEFPKRGEDGNSITFELDDVVSLSYSVYRAKPAVVLLGQSSIDGFALGTKTVAGSLIRSVFSHDKLTLLQSSMLNKAQQGRAERLERKNNMLPKGTPYKELSAYMKDDLTTFNIHCVSITENLQPHTGEPYMRTDSIMGCMIINNGQVFSIEDLVTEGNFSYQAKNVKSTVGAPDDGVGFSTQPAFKSVSELMGNS